MKIDKRKINKGLEKVKVFAPATVANMVCGFDILGFAIHNPGDIVKIEKREELGVEIRSISGDQGRLPLEAYLNTVSASVLKMLEYLEGVDFGLWIDLEKSMPIGSGLGSSAASTVAGIYAANIIFGEPFTKDELLHFAILGEELACGQGHADNVAPCLFGGITLVRSYDPLEIVQLPTPKDAHIAVVFPNVDVPTRDARKIIKDQIPLQVAVKQWGNIAGLISALYRDDVDLMGRCMVDEWIEPVRSVLIPCFDEMKSTALANGAVSFGISGSGPSVFALCKDSRTAKRIARELQSILRQNEVDSLGFCSPIQTVGPVVL